MTARPPPLHDFGPPVALPDPITPPVLFYALGAAQHREGRLALDYTIDFGGPAPIGPLFTLSTAHPRRRKTVGRAVRALFARR